MLPQVREGPGFHKREPGWAEARLARVAAGIPERDSRLLREDVRAWLNDRPTLSKTARIVAHKLADKLTDYRLNQGQSWVRIGNVKLAEACGCSTRTVQRALGELEIAGLVDRLCGRYNRRRGEDSLSLLGLLQQACGYRSTLARRSKCGRAAGPAMSSQGDIRDTPLREENPPIRKERKDSPTESAQACAGRSAEPRSEAWDPAIIAAAVPDLGVDRSQAAPIDERDLSDRFQDAATRLLGEAWRVAPAWQSAVRTIGLGEAAARLAQAVLQQQERHVTNPAGLFCSLVRAATVDCGLVQRAIERWRATQANAAALAALPKRVSATLLRVKGDENRAGSVAQMLADARYETDGDRLIIIAASPFMANYLGSAESSTLDALARAAGFRYAAVVHKTGRRGGDVESAQPSLPERSSLLPGAA